MRNLPNQAAEPVGDRPKRLLIAQARQQTPEDHLEMAPFRLHRRLRRLRQHPAHHAHLGNHLLRRVRSKAGYLRQPCHHLLMRFQGLAIRRWSLAICSSTRRRCCRYSVSSSWCIALLAAVNQAHHFMSHLGARALTERRCSRPAQDATVDSTLLPTRSHPDRRSSRNSLPRKPREPP